jgi:hypothetical protein
MSALASGMRSQFRWRGPGASDSEWALLNPEPMSKDVPLWKSKPVVADYAAALSFLSLIYPKARALRVVSALRRAKAVRHAAKDLLRASGLPLLPRDAAKVQTDLKRLHKDKPLSPVLLVQGDMSRGIPLTVADGYHRICAVCYFDENTPISCRMVRD